jgi:hypothetical protein
LDFTIRDISSFAIERLQLRRQTPRPGTHVRLTWKDATNMALTESGLMIEYD